MERKTKTSAKVKNRYNAKAYDRINLIVPKGKKAVIEARAKLYDKSVNAFINRAIDEAMEKACNTDIISVEIEGDLKEKADVLFAELGIDIETAINLFLRQSIARNGLPL